jgi:hypothetical protein
MTDSHEWNPEDGDAPTAQETADARALAEALVERESPAKIQTSQSISASLDEVVRVAMRVRATAHTPKREDSISSAHAAVEAVVEDRRVRSRTRSWLRIAAVAAVAVGGIVGAQWINFSLGAPSGPSTIVPITRATDDVFRSALPNNSGSTPIAMIDDSRIRSFRSNLFARGGRSR